jgi:hypothetical protein
VVNLLGGVLAHKPVQFGIPGAWSHGLDSLVPEFESDAPDWAET